MKDFEVGDLVISTISPDVRGVIKALYFDSDGNSMADVDIGSTGGETQYILNRKIYVTRIVCHFDSIEKVNK